MRCPRPWPRLLRTAPWRCRAAATASAARAAILASVSRCPGSLQTAHCAVLCGGVQEICLSLRALDYWDGSTAARHACAWRSPARPFRVLADFQVFALGCGDICAVIPGDENTGGSFGRSAHRDPHKVSTSPAHPTAPPPTRAHPIMGRALPPGPEPRASALLMAHGSVPCSKPPPPRHSPRGWLLPAASRSSAAFRIPDV